MPKLISKDKSFCQQSSLCVCLTHLCARGLHFALNTDCRSPKKNVGSVCVSVQYLEQDADLPRCIGKYQIILAFGVYFSLSVVIPQRFYQKDGERSDQVNHLFRVKRNMT